MPIVTNGIEITRRVSGGIEINQVVSGGIQVFTTIPPIENVDGTAIYSSFVEGTVVGGTFSDYSYGIFTYTPLTAPSDEEFITQTGTAASVAANFTGATRNDRRECIVDTSAPNGGLPSGTGVAGTCTNPANAIGGADNQTRTGLTRQQTGITPTVANGGIMTRVVDNDDYIPDLTPSISGVTETEGPHNFTVTWSVSNDENLTDHTFHFSTDEQTILNGGGSGILLITNLDGTYTADQLEGNNETTYYYRIATESSGGTDTFDGSVTTTAASDTPTPFLIAQGGEIVSTTQLYVQWNIAIGDNRPVTSFWGIGTTAALAVADLKEDESRNFTATDLTPGTTYHYIVRAVGSGGTGTLTGTLETLAAMTDCFNYTFVPGTSGDAADVASYVLCTGEIFSFTTIPDLVPFTACILEGSQTTPGNGSWTKGNQCNLVAVDGTASYDQTDTTTTGGGNQATSDLIVSNLPATSTRLAGVMFQQTQTYRTRSFTTASSTEVEFTCNRDSFPSGGGVEGTCTIPVATGVESPASGTVQNLTDTYTNTTTVAQGAPFDTSNNRTRLIDAVGTGVATDVDGTASYGDAVVTTGGGITTDDDEVIVSRSPEANTQPAGVDFMQTVTFRIPTSTTAATSTSTFTCDRDTPLQGGGSAGTCTVPTGSTTPAAGTTQAIDEFYSVTTQTAEPGSTTGTDQTRMETVVGTLAPTTFTFRVEGPSTGFGEYRIATDSEGGTATGDISNYRWSTVGQVSPSTGSGETFTTVSAPAGQIVITLVAERGGVDGTDDMTTFIF